MSTRLLVCSLGPSLVACAPALRPARVPDALNDPPCRVRHDEDGDGRWDRVVERRRGAALGRERLLHEVVSVHGETVREFLLEPAEDGRGYWVGLLADGVVRAVGWELHPGGAVAARHAVRVQSKEPMWDTLERPFRESTFYDEHGTFISFRIDWQSDIYHWERCGHANGRLRWCVGARADLHVYPFEIVFEWNDDGTVRRWITDRFARGEKSSRTVYTPKENGEVLVHEDKDHDGVADVVVTVDSAWTGPPGGAPPSAEEPEWIPAPAGNPWALPSDGWRERVDETGPATTLRREDADDSVTELELTYADGRLMSALHVQTRDDRVVARVERTYVCGGKLESEVRRHFWTNIHPDSGPPPALLREVESGDVTIKPPSHPAAESLRSGTPRPAASSDHCGVRHTWTCATSLSQPLGFAGRPAGPLRCFRRAEDRA